MALGARSLAAACTVAIVSLAASVGLAQDSAAQPSVAAPAAKAAARQPIPPAELEAFVDGLASEGMSRGHIAGAVVTVVQNGQVLLDKGYGLDRLRPARPVAADRTLFRLGAVTESFTWIALAREIEAGRMRLDAPVNVYLPQADQIPDQGFSQPIRLRDLMTHTAGFEDRTYGQLMEDDPSRIRPLETYLKQERPRRVRAPGLLPSRSAYSAALAGEALTQVTGKTMQALVQAEITGPLGMRNTTLREPYPARQDLPASMDAATADNLSQGFAWTRDGFRQRPFEYMTQIAPARSGSATGADMARYMMAILGDGTLSGTSIYSPQVAKDFRTPLWGPAPGASSWDYGVHEFALPGGLRGYGLEGATLSFRSSLTTVPALGLGVFVAANTEGAEAFTHAIAGQIVERFYAPAPAPAAGSDWLLQNAPAFTGDYQTTARAYAGLERFVDLLLGNAHLSVTPEGFLLAPGPAGTQRWVPDAAASLDAPQVLFHRADGPGILVFDIAGGRATRWLPPSVDQAYARAPIWSHRWLLALLAGLTAAAGCAAVGGLFLRDRRDFRQTSIQGRADAAQVSASILWITAIAGFWIWRWSAFDAADLMYRWPGAWLLIASACAFVASIMTAVCLVLLPVAWRGGRRLDSWTIGRKARFTFTTLLFVAFAVVLGFWGALEPWSR